MLRKIEGKRRKGTAEDEMVGWHHQLNGHEFEQTLGDSEGQGRWASYSPWSYKELDVTQRLSNSNNEGDFFFFSFHTKSPGGDGLGPDK